MIQLNSSKDFATITMNRPEVNAIDLKFVEEFHRALDDIEDAAREKDAPARTLVIDSAVPAYFSFGFDLPTLVRSEYRHVYRMLSGYLELVRRILIFPMPVIALIEGRCIAGGMVLALAADYRISAGNKSRFMLNEVNLNIPFPRGIVELVVSICGSMKARELLSSGRSLRPEEALASGIIDEHLSQETVRARLKNRVQYFSARPSFGFQKLKEARVKGITNLMAEDLRREKVNQLLVEIASQETRSKIGKLLKRLELLGIETAPEASLAGPQHDSDSIHNMTVPLDHVAGSLHNSSQDGASAFANRRSIRAFLPEEVPVETLNRILSVAARAPSSKNMQPYGIAITTKMERKKMSALLIKNFRKGIKPNPDYPSSNGNAEMKRRALELGKDYYSWLGINRKDGESRKEIWERNYLFWNAPEALFIYTFSGAQAPEILDCGIFLGFLLGAMEAEGLGSIPQASLVEYPDVVRSVLKLPATAKLLVGVSFGFADPGEKINLFQTKRMNLTELTRR